MFRNGTPCSNFNPCKWLGKWLLLIRTWAMPWVPEFREIVVGRGYRNTPWKTKHNVGFKRIRFSACQSQKAVVHTRINSCSLFRVQFQVQQASQFENLFYKLSILNVDQNILRKLNYNVSCFLKIWSGSWFCRSLRLVHGTVLKHNRGDIAMDGWEL